MSKKPFRVPHLNNMNADPSKNWFVEYGFRHPVTGKIVRKRTGEGLTADIPQQDREKNARKLIVELTAKLQRGWTPLDESDVVVYDDVLMYAQAARVYSRKRVGVKDIRFYSNQFVASMDQTKAKKTFESYNGKMRTFTTWLEKNKKIDLLPEQIDNGIIIDYFDYLINDQKLAGRTIDKYKVVMNKFFTHLISREVIAQNPVFGIEIPEIAEDYSARPFADDDLAKIMPIMRQTDPQLFLAAMFQYFCFVRPGDELLEMKISQINFTDWKIFIPKSVAKKRRERNIDIPAQLMELMMQHNLHLYGKDLYVFGRNRTPGPKPVGYNTLRVRFNVIRDDKNLSAEYKWYSFKHTGAGKLLKSGATIVELMHQLGHTDMASTYRYVKRHFGIESKHVMHAFPSPPGF